MSWEERKAEAPEAGGGPRAWNVFVSVSVRPRKEERVSKIGTVSVSNQEPAVSTGNDWLASSAPGHGAPCPGLAAQAEGSPDLQQALPGVWPAPRKDQAALPEPGDRCDQAAPSGSRLAPPPWTTNTRR